MADEPDPLKRYGQDNNAYDAQFGRRIDAAIGRTVRRSPPPATSDSGGSGGSGGGGGSGAGWGGAGVVIFVILLVIRLALVSDRNSRRSNDYQPRFDHNNFHRVDDDWNRPLPPARHFRDGDDPFGGPPGNIPPANP